MPATDAISVVRPVEYEQLSDLLDAYFQAVREYNLALGAFDLSPDELRDAHRREALSYAKVRKLKERLVAGGIAI